MRSTALLSCELHFNDHSNMFLFGHKAPDAVRESSLVDVRFKCGIARRCTLDFNHEASAGLLFCYFGSLLRFTFY